MKPLLSVVTVNFNNMAGLESTLASVSSQSFADYEHIIIDAGSTDGSADVVRRYAESSPHCTFWVSEPDNGIYDGMNKGIDHASGEYLLFMNSGDYLDGRDVLSRVTFDGSDYIYGDVKVVLASGETVYVRSPYPLDPVFILLKDTICHQSCFINRRLFRDGQRYRTDYVLASDWIHIVENLVLKNGTCRYEPVCIAVHDGNGISATSGTLGVDERMRWIRENIPRMFYDALVELDEYRSSEFGALIPKLKGHRTFARWARRLVRDLFRIYGLFVKK